MNFKHILTGIALGAFSSGIFAVPIPLPEGQALLSDNNAEELINLDLGLDPGTEGGVDHLDVGDRLRGIFNINSVEPGTDVTPFGAGNNELTGVFDIVVTSKVLAGPSVIPGEFNWFYTFAASGNLGTPGAAVEMYYDPLQDYDRGPDGCATVALCEATATNGSLWAAFSPAGGFWSAFAFTDDISVVAATSLPLGGGLFNSAQNLLVNNTGYTFNQIPCGAFLVDVCASGILLGITGASTPYDSFSNVDFVLNRVPVPAPVYLMGLGLLLLSGFSRRKVRG